MTSLASSLSPATDLGVTLAIAAVLRDEAGAVEQLSLLDVQDVLASARHHGVSGLLRKQLVARTAVGQTFRSAGSARPEGLAYTGPRTVVGQTFRSAGSVVGQTFRSAGSVVGQTFRSAGSGSASADSGLCGLLDAEVRLDAITGSWRRQQATRVIDGLHRAGLPTLVLKGDALAHTHYSAPYLRPRCDTDVLVRTGDTKRAKAVLASLGYVREPMVDRELVHTQCSFGLTDRSQTHFVDLHWAISCRPLFAGMTTFEELARDARPLDALGEYARTPSPVWSLLLGCIHRVAHHNDTDRLIWLYDFKLLADGLTAEEWTLFWALASGRDLVEVCRAGLSLTDIRIGLSPGASRALSRRVSPRHYEPATEFLGGQMTTLKMIALDAKAVRGVMRKARLVASHIFPDRRYMREVFHVRTKFGLVAAYARRATAGAWRLIH